MTNDAISGTAAHTFDWDLDNLGNWSGDTATPLQSVVETTTTGGTTYTRAVQHDADARNELDATALSTWSTTSGNSTTPVDFAGTTLYDAGGNLVYAGIGVLSDDRAYWFQYDGFNRLVQVNDAGTVVAGDFLDGSSDPAERGQIDPDALESPTSHAPGDLIAHFVYDGLGRLVRKEAPFKPTGWTCTPGTQTTDYFYDGARRIRERQYSPAPSGCSDTWSTPLWRDRDYLYGPDYVDEFIAYVQDDTNPAYVIQDANYDVVGVFNKGTTAGSNPANLLGEQYTWTPYGEVSAKAVSSGLPHCRIGHQGLFFDTLEIRGAEVLKPGDAGIYYNRNRFYSPKLGRFLNRDPNESGVPTLAMAMNGQSVAPLLGGIDLMTQFQNGPNLAAYQGESPLGHLDPSGEFFELGGLSDLASSSAVQFSLGALNVGSGLATGLDFVNNLVSGVSLRNALLDVVINAAFDRVAGKALDKALDVFVAGAVFLKKMFRKGGCFVSGTPVETVDGPRMIEDLIIGDRLLTVPEDSPDVPEQVSFVTATYCARATAILHLQFENDTHLRLTPDHVLWTERAGWIRAAELIIGDVVRSTTGEVCLLTVSVVPGEVDVYNLSVDGTRTYFADEILVHNSCRIRNVRLAGSVHPDSGVPFDANGFPDFSKWTKADVHIVPTGNRAQDFAAANAAAGFSSTPAGMTWHHHQDFGRMQLVPTDIHTATAHTGGFSLWEDTE